MKTACVYHSIYIDGWMSAAVVRHWFIKNHREYLITDDLAGLLDITGKGLDGDHLHLIGYNYGQPIPDLSEFDKIIMCDISFPREEMKKLLEGTGDGTTKEFIWLDHHISAIKELHAYLPQGYIFPAGIRDTKLAACELTWMFFFPEEKMPEIVRLLGRYDCFGHKGTLEEQKVLEFQYGARQVITNYGEAYEWLTNSFHFENEDVYKIHSKGIAIHRYLVIEAKQSYANGFELPLYLIGLLDPYDKEAVERHNKKPRYVDTYETYKFIAINKERFNPINFGIDYHKDGYDGTACFHYDGKANLWRFSLYNDNGKVDCSQIAKQFGGGGHKGAAGFVLTTEEFNKICLKYLDNANKN